jgi:hypothetical protein
MFYKQHRKLRGKLYKNMRKTDRPSRLGDFRPRGGEPPLPLNRQALAGTEKTTTVIHQKPMKVFCSFSHTKDGDGIRTAILAGLGQQFKKS